MITQRGVKKVSENIVQPGRALIITEENTNAYDWNSIPDGSLHVNPINGMISVKLEGQTTWVPSGLKNDGTICIAKDSKVVIETFVIVTVDDGNGTFTYMNQDGEQRHKPITTEGYHVFELENGSYMRGRNHLEITIDDLHRRDVASGGVIELTEERFAITEELVEGQEITVKYTQVFNVGNPYPRIFMDTEEPVHAEIGDLWIDYDGVLNADEVFEEDSIFDGIKEDLTPDPEPENPDESIVISQKIYKLPIPPTDTDCLWINTIDRTLNYYDNGEWKSFVGVYSCI